MNLSLTARSAAKHGVPDKCTTCSPYSGLWVEIIGAKFQGDYHVELMTSLHRPMIVDQGHKLYRPELKRGRKPGQKSTKEE